MSRAVVEGATTIAVRSREPSAVLRAVLEWAAARGVPELPDLLLTRPSLEDVYLRMIAESRIGVPLPASTALEGS